MKKVYILLLGIILLSIFRTSFASDFKVRSGGVDIKQDSDYKIGGVSVLSYGILTIDHTISAVLNSGDVTKKRHTNQGATGTIELGLPVVTSTSGPVMFEQQETQVIEIAPQTGEIVILDGVVLSAGNEVDSDGSTIGSRLVCMGSKNASGVAIWTCDSDGTWLDGGAAD